MDQILATQVVATRAGGPQVLEVRTAPIPTLAPDEVLIANEAVGVAFADVMMRLGRYPGYMLPRVPGFDAVGTIVAVGGEVAEFALGDRVAAMTISGGYASHVVARTVWLARVPKEIPAETVAATTLNYTTAWQMLTRCARLERGDTILVHGAAGGVGTALLDLARGLGLRVLGTASARKHALVSSLGGIPIDYAREDFVAMAHQDGGVQAAFDHVGGAHLLKSLQTLRPSGAVVSYGAYALFRNGEVSVPSYLKAVASRMRLDPLHLLTFDQSLIGYGIGVERDARAAQFRADFQTVMNKLALGDINPIIDRTYPLVAAGAAQSRLEQAQASGKIVLLV
jgi:NADPH:quinone reductase-like Zn-dependent oxidoreductase